MSFIQMKFDAEGGPVPSVSEPSVMADIVAMYNHGFRPTDEDLTATSLGQIAENFRDPTGAAAEIDVRVNPELRAMVRCDEDDNGERG